MSDLLVTIFSFSLFLAGIIGLVRFSRIGHTYRPFLYLVWLGCINEGVSFYLRLQNEKPNTMPNNNIYALVEALLILWFLKQGETFNKSRIKFYILLTSIPVFWIIETLLVRNLYQYSIYFRIYYAFIIVVLSIDMINFLLDAEQKNLLRNPVFLICTGFIIYFTYKILVNSFWIYGILKSNTFLFNLNSIMIIINLFTNLIFTLAVLWIPTKHRSILPS